MNYPKVSIIVLNWNGQRDTIECLESIRRMAYPNYEVIVVDNKSDGDDVRVIKERAGGYAHILENDRNYGFCEGNNIGMRYVLQHSKPAYFLLLNNDTIVDPESLTKLVETAEADLSIGIVGPKVYFHAEPNTIQSVGGSINWWTSGICLLGYGEADHGQHDEIKEVDWVSGCALLIKQSTIQDIGLFYPGYFALLEDVDWCARCGKAGYKVVCSPQSKVWHKTGKTIDRTSGSRQYYMARNPFLLMRRNAAKLQIASFLVHFFLIDVASNLWSLFRQRQMGLAGAYFRGIRDGLPLVLREPKHATPYADTRPQL